MSINMSFCILIVEIPKEWALLYCYTQIRASALRFRSSSVNAEYPIHRQGLTSAANPRLWKGDPDFS